MLMGDSIDRVRADGLVISWSHRGPFEIGTRLALHRATQQD